MAGSTFMLRSGVMSKLDSSASTLLYHARHLEILDEYGKTRTAGLKQKIAKEYHAYIELRKKLESLNLNQEQRLREMDFCRFEIDEIENADLKPGEEEECQSVYRRFSNAKRITESLALAHEAVSTDEISRALSLYFSQINDFRI